VSVRPRFFRARDLFGAPIRPGGVARGGRQRFISKHTRIVEDCVNHYFISSVVQYSKYEQSLFPPWHAPLQALALRSETLALVTYMSEIVAPSKAELVEMHAQIEQLRLDMAARSAGGKQTSGRYKKHDTARKVFVETVAIPSLRLGKRVDAADWRRLFLPGDDDIHGVDKIDMDRWSILHKVDPRSASAESYQLDSAKQLTLLQWVAKNPKQYIPPQPAPSGTPREHRLTARESKLYSGFTLRQLAVDGDRRKLVPGARVPAGSTLLFLASPRYAWRFPEHVPLFISLSALERAGCTTMGNRGVVAISAAHARAAYESYAQKDLAPRDDDDDVLASAQSSSCDVDPLLSQPAEPAFATINTISLAQQAFFQRTVASMSASPYEDWTSLWVTPPDPSLQPFDHSSSAAWEALAIFFFSPTKWGSSQQMQLAMPCARHGWAHARFVHVRNCWAQRLVKGVFSDFSLAGQECRCSECRRERATLKQRYDAAKSAGVEESELEALKSSVDAASFCWMTYDARVMAFYFERAPWVALKLPAIVTHKVCAPIHFCASLAIPHCTTHSHLRYMCIGCTLHGVPLAPHNSRAQGRG
jgi:hypothetical protein